MYGMYNEDDIEADDQDYLRGNTFVRGDHVGQHSDGGRVNTSKPQCVHSQHCDAVQCKICCQVLTPLCYTAMS